MMRKFLARKNDRTKDEWTLAEKTDESSSAKIDTENEGWRLAHTCQQGRNMISLLGGRSRMHSGAWSHR